MILIVLLSYYLALSQTVESKSFDETQNLPYFRVPTGLTLSEIAVYFYGSPILKAQEIAKLNHLSNKNKLKPNQKLLLPSLPLKNQAECVQRLHAMWARIGKKIPVPRSYPELIFPENQVGDIDSKKQNAVQWIEKGDYARALEQIQEIKKTAPDDLATSLREIYLQIKLGHHSEAVELAQIFSQSYPDLAALPVLQKLTNGDARDSGVR